MKRLLGGFLFILLLLAFVGEARATTIAPNCGTCGSHNTAWDLTLALINDSREYLPADRHRHLWLAAWTSSG